MDNLENYIAMEPEELIGVLGGLFQNGMALDLVDIDGLRDDAFLPDKERYIYNAAEMALETIDLDELYRNAEELKIPEKYPGFFKFLTELQMEIEGHEDRVPEEGAVEEAEEAAEGIEEAIEEGQQFSLGDQALKQIVEGGHTGKESFNYKWQDYDQRQAELTEAYNKLMAEAAAARAAGDTGASNLIKGHGVQPFNTEQPKINIAFEEYQKKREEAIQLSREAAARAAKEASDANNRIKSVHGDGDAVPKRAGQDKTHGGANGTLESGHVQTESGRVIGISDNSVERVDSTHEPTASSHTPAQQKHGDGTHGYASEGPAHQEYEDAPWGEALDVRKNGQHESQPQPNEPSPARTPAQGTAPTQDHKHQKDSYTESELKAKEEKENRQKENAKSQEPAAPKPQDDMCHGTERIAPQDGPRKEAERIAPQGTIKPQEANPAQQRPQEPRQEMARPRPESAQDVTVGFYAQKQGDRLVEVDNDGKRHEYTVSGNGTVDVNGMTGSVYTAANGLAFVKFEGMYQADGKTMSADGQDFTDRIPQNMSVYENPVSMPHEVYGRYVPQNESRDAEQPGTLGGTGYKPSSEPKADFARDGKISADSYTRDELLRQQEAQERQNRAKENAKEGTSQGASQGAQGKAGTERITAGQEKTGSGVIGLYAQAENGRIISITDGTEYKRNADGTVDVGGMGAAVYDAGDGRVFLKMAPPMPQDGRAQEGWRIPEGAVKYTKPEEMPYQVQGLPDDAWGHVQKPQDVPRPQITGLYASYEDGKYIDNKTGAEYGINANGTVNVNGIEAKAYGMASGQAFLRFEEQPSAEMGPKMPESVGVYEKPEDMPSAVPELDAEWHGWGQDSPKPNEYMDGDKQVQDSYSRAGQTGNGAPWDADKAKAREDAGSVNESPAKNAPAGAGSGRIESPHNPPAQQAADVAPITGVYATKQGDKYVDEATGAEYPVNGNGTVNVGGLDGKAYAAEDGRTFIAFEPQAVGQEGTTHYQMPEHAVTYANPEEMPYKVPEFGAGSQGRQVQDSYGRAGQAGNGAPQDADKAKVREDTGSVKESPAKDAPAGAESGRIESPHKPPTQQAAGAAPITGVYAIKQGGRYVDEATGAEYPVNGNGTVNIGGLDGKAYAAEGGRAFIVFDPQAAGHQMPENAVTYESPEDMPYKVPEFGMPSQGRQVQDSYGRAGKTGNGAPQNADKAKAREDAGSVKESPAKDAPAGVESGRIESPHKPPTQQAAVAAPITGVYAIKQGDRYVNEATGAEYRLNSNGTVNIGGLDGKIYAAEGGRAFIVFDPQAVGQEGTTHYQMPEHAVTYANPEEMPYKVPEFGAGSQGRQVQDSYGRAGQTGAGMPRTQGAGKAEIGTGSIKDSEKIIPGVAGNERIGRSNGEAGAVTGVYALRKGSKLIDAESGAEYTLRADGTVVIGGNIEATAHEAEGGRVFLKFHTPAAGNGSANAETGSPANTAIYEKPEDMPYKVPEFGSDLLSGKQIQDSYGKAGQSPAGSGASSPKHGAAEVKTIHEGSGTERIGRASDSTGAIVGLYAIKQDGMFVDAGGAEYRLEADGTVIVDGIKTRPMEAEGGRVFLKAEGLGQAQAAPNGMASYANAADMPHQVEGLSGAAKSGVNVGLYAQAINGKAVIKAADGSVAEYAISKEGTIEIGPMKVPVSQESDGRLFVGWKDAKVSGQQVTVSDGQTLSVGDGGLAYGDGLTQGFIVMRDGKTWAPDAPFDAGNGEHVPESMVGKIGGAGNRQAVDIGFDAEMDGGKLIIKTHGNELVERDIQADGTVLIGGMKANVYMSSDGAVFVGWKNVSVDRNGLAQIDGQDIAIDATAKTVPAADGQAAFTVRPSSIRARAAHGSREADAVAVAPAGMSVGFYAKLQDGKAMVKAPNGELIEYAIGADGTTAIGGLKAHVYGIGGGQAFIGWTDVRQDGHGLITGDGQRLTLGEGGTMAYGNGGGQGFFILHDGQPIPKEMGGGPEMDSALEGFLRNPMRGTGNVAGTGVQLNGKVGDAAAGAAQRAIGDGTPGASAISIGFYAQAKDGKIIVKNAAGKMAEYAISPDGTVNIGGIRAEIQDLGNGRVAVGWRNATVREQQATLGGGPTLQLNPDGMAAIPGTGQEVWLLKGAQPAGVPYDTQTGRQTERIGGKGAKTVDVGLNGIMRGDQVVINVNGINKTYTIRPDGTIALNGTAVKAYDLGNGKAFIGWKGGIMGEDGTITIEGGKMLQMEKGRAFVKVGATDMLFDVVEPTSGMPLGGGSFSSSAFGQAQGGPQFKHDGTSHTVEGTSFYISSLNVNRVLNDAGMNRMLDRQGRAMRHAMNRKHLEAIYNIEWSQKDIDIMVANYANIISANTNARHAAMFNRYLEDTYLSREEITELFDMRHDLLRMGLTTTDVNRLKEMLNNGQLSGDEAKATLDYIKKYDKSREKIIRDGILKNGGAGNIETGFLGASLPILMRENGIPTDPAAARGLLNEGKLTGQQRSIAEAYLVVTHSLNARDRLLHLAHEAARAATRTISRATNTVMRYARRYMGDDLTMKGTLILAQVLVTAIRMPFRAVRLVRLARATGRNAAAVGRATFHVARSVGRAARDIGGAAINGIHLGRAAKKGVKHTVRITSRAVKKSATKVAQSGARAAARGAVRVIQGIIRLLGLLLQALASFLGPVILGILIVLVIIFTIFALFRNSADEAYYDAGDEATAQVIQEMVDVLTLCNDSFKDYISEQFGRARASTPATGTDMTSTSPQLKKGESSQVAGLYDITEGSWWNYELSWTTYTPGAPSGSRNVYDMVHSSGHTIRSSGGYAFVDEKYYLAAFTAYWGNAGDVLKIEFSGEVAIGDQPATDTIYVIIGDHKDYAHTGYPAEPEGLYGHKLGGHRDLIEFIGYDSYIPANLNAGSTVIPVKATNLGSMLNGTFDDSLVGTSGSTRSNGLNADVLYRQEITKSTYDKIVDRDNNIFIMTDEKPDLPDWVSPTPVPAGGSDDDMEYYFYNNNQELISMALAIFDFDINGGTDLKKDAEDNDAGETESVDSGTDGEVQSTYTSKQNEDTWKLALFLEQYGMGIPSGYTGDDAELNYEEGGYDDLKYSLLVGLYNASHIIMQTDIKEYHKGPDGTISPNTDGYSYQVPLQQAVVHTTEDGSTFTSWDYVTDSDGDLVYTTAYSPCPGHTEHSAVVITLHFDSLLHLEKWWQDNVYGVDGFDSNNPNYDAKQKSTVLKSTFQLIHNEDYIKAVDGTCSGIKTTASAFATGHMTETQAEVARTVYNFLTSDLGLTHNQSIGVLVNMYDESGLDYTKNQTGGGAYGICQWDGGRKIRLREWCNAHPGDGAYNTLSGQLSYLKAEFTVYASDAFNGDGGVTIFRQKETIEDAAAYFTRYFERPLAVYRDQRCQPDHIAAIAAIIESYL